MNRPWIIWSLSGLCALLVFGAMAMITRHTLSLEKDRAHAEAKAEFEGWVRLALWRMDSAASGILAEENNRPAWQFKDVDLNRPQKSNPLNRYVPEKVKHYFEVQKGVVSAPNKTADWGSLQSLLHEESTSAVRKKEQKNQKVRQADNNLDVLRAVAQSSKEVNSKDAQWDAQVAVAKQQRASKSNEVLRNSQEYQTNYNLAEKVKRQSIVNKSKASIQQKEIKGVPAAKPSVLSDQLEDVVPLAPHLSLLTPVWLGEDLVLVREVNDDGGTRLQGVWLDASSIRQSLLEDISDLLPNARLEPVRQGLSVLLGEVADVNADDPMVMAALPWRLLPGAVNVAEPVGWTPMRKTLILAWIGAGLAALAAVVLLRGVVKLSERRASFVSSVTHELRTPLTTFSLYSDMLAEGMIKDEEKKMEYLSTLRRESARLTHLVENVLAYSRIERGSARARIESVRVGDLIARMTDRLQQRVEEAGMKLRIEIPDQLEGHEIHIDTTAVEQIIFNLVDNASKYANGDGCGELITLRALSLNRGRGVALQVCDQGAGIQKSEHRRLFRAFHKSAQEAAHTKPGVGLGLALSRRLARALGGDLKIIEQEQGACFELSLK